MTNEQVQLQSGQLMISERAAMRSKNILYQGLAENPQEIDNIDVELSSRLCGVLQSLQTDRFLETNSKTGKKETEGAFQKRQERLIQGAMDQIDQTYKQMDIEEHGRTFKKAEMLDL